MLIHVEVKSVQLEDVLSQNDNRVLYVLSFSEIQDFEQYKLLLGSRILMELGLQQGQLAHGEV